MNIKEKNELLQLVKYALDPEDIDYLAKSYQEDGNIRYLTIFKSKAVVEYFETGQPEAYWDNMRRVGELQIELFKRFEAGDRISSDYVGPTTLGRVIDCLSGGNYDLIPTLASCMSKVKVDKNFYNFKLIYHLLVGTDASEDLIKSKTYAQKHRKWDLIYNRILQSIFSKSIDDFETAIKDMMLAYKKMYRYELPEYKLIAITPLFFIQLARHYGMDVQVQHELIPQNLIKPVQLSR